MTYTGIERLVSRILQALQARSDDLSNSASLAKEYVETCRLVALRLEQCGALLTQGNELQALQLAEVSPPLLEVIRLLSFSKEKEWFAYCREKRLPVVTPFNSAVITRLNQSYGKGINPNHPLIAEYREAILRRNDVQAMNALRSILRLNPSDKNSTEELHRLESKIVSKEMDSLRNLLAKGTADEICEKVQTIQALNFKVPPDNPLYVEGVRRQKEILRAKEYDKTRKLLAQIAPLYRRDDFDKAEPLILEIAKQKSEYEFEFQGEDQSRWDEYKKWINQILEGDKQLKEFEAASDELTRQIQLAEEHLAMEIPVPELERDIEFINSLYKALLEIESPVPVPPELDENYKGIISRLTDKISQIAQGKVAKQRTALIAIIVVVIVIIVLVVGYVLYTTTKHTTVKTTIKKVESTFFLEHSSLES